MGESGRSSVRGDIFDRRGLYYGFSPPRLVKCKEDSEGFCVARVARMKRVLTATPRVGTDVELNTKTAESAARMVFSGLDVATADPLWSLPDELLLH